MHCLGLALVVVVSLLAPILGHAQTTRVNVGVSATIDQHGSCRVVTNGCGADLMVPHNISAEWTSFISNAPGCATRTLCPVTDFSYVGTASGSGTSASLPGGFAAGDLAILYTFLDIDMTVYTATSMTLVAGDNLNTSSIRTFAKILDGGEGGGIGGLPTGTQWISLVLRPNGLMESFTAHSPTSANNWQFQAVTLQSGSAPRKPAVALGSFGAPFNVTTMFGISPTATMTTLAGAATTHQAHYYVFPSAGSLSNFDFTLSDGGSRQKTQTVTLVFN